MLQLRHYSFQLPFQYPFTIAKGSKTHQPTFVVSLGMGQLTGYGEAPAIAYYGVTVDGMAERLERVRPVIERYALMDPHRFWHFLHHLLPDQHFLIAALDIAGWDLFGRLRRKPLHQLLDLKWEGAPLTDYTIGLGTAEEMTAKVQAHPWPLYKIKLADAGGIDLLRALRQVTDAPFRVDMNEAWTFEDAKRLLPELQQLGVELVEQPLPRDAWEEMKALKAFSPIPVFADEACQTAKDVARCAEGFHGINIKLTKCGGITPALGMIKEARQLGLKVMLGSMNDGTIGASAVAHLLPLADAADIDGPLLLREDLASGLTYTDGVIGVSAGSGLGIQFWGEPRPASWMTGE